MKRRLFRVDACLVRAYNTGAYCVSGRTITYSCYQMAETADEAMQLVRTYYMPLNTAYDYMQAEACEEVEA